MDGSMGGWTDGQILSYQEGSRNSRVRERNFTPKIATMIKNPMFGASLVAQWLRVCLPMQGTRVRALVWEDPTCRGATGPVSHSYWACASGACKKKRIPCSQASLVVQWLRIRLPVQGTRVRSLVWEDPTGRGANKPMHHSYWACALDVLAPASHNYWARAPQLLKPVRLEPVLHNKRNHHNEKPAHRNEE